MDIQLKISKRDVKKLQQFVLRHQDNAFVVHRLERNVTNPPASPTVHKFWFALVKCLLTTQQKSGPDSPVVLLTQESPFPLGYRTCMKERNLQRYVEKLISEYGLRFNQKLAQQISVNLDGLNHGLWEEIRACVKELIENPGRDAERKAAEFVDERLVGFGPKQSRNLLQMLGLTRYEIPIDSRVIKWLREFGFPIELSSAALGDVGFYYFVLDCIQEMCERADVYPTVLDAAIFSSFDGGKWDEAGVKGTNNIVW